MNEIQSISHKLYTRVVTLIKGQRELFLDLGFTLKQIKDLRSYENMGDGGFDTWRSFLANPEINISPSMADVYIKIYEYYIEKLGMPRDEVLEIPIVRLNMMKSKLENMETNQQRDDLIAKAKTLSYNDFKIEAVNNGVELKKAINVHKCDKCQKLVIQYDVSQVCTCTGGVDITPY